MTDAASDVPLRDALRQALGVAGDTHTWADVCGMLHEGRAQLWTNDGAAVVTELIPYPRMTAINYWLVGGELAHVLALQGEIDAWAREHGAVRATALGRKGWRPTLERCGWRAHGAAYAKELT